MINFVKSLMTDAQPKAEAIQRAAKSAANTAVNNAGVRVVSNITRGLLVNTVGIGLVLSKPAVDKARDLGSKVCEKLSALASDTTATR